MRDFRLSRYALRVVRRNGGVAQIVEAPAAESARAGPSTRHPLESAHGHKDREAVNQAVEQLWPDLLHTKPVSWRHPERT